jgi:hypothetical protein
LGKFGEDFVGGCDGGLLGPLFVLGEILVGDVLTEFLSGRGRALGGVDGGGASLLNDAGWRFEQTAGGEQKANREESKHGGIVPQIVKRGSKKSPQEFLRALREVGK